MSSQCATKCEKKSPPTWPSRPAKEVARNCISLATREHSNVTEQSDAVPVAIEKQTDHLLPPQLPPKNASVTSSILARSFDRPLISVPSHHLHSSEPTTNSASLPSAENATSPIVPAPYQELEPWEYAGLEAYQREHGVHTRDHIRDHIHGQVEKMRRVLLQLNESRSTINLDGQSSTDTDDWLKHPSGNFDDGLQIEDYGMVTPMSSRGSLLQIDDMYVDIKPVGKTFMVNIVPALRQESSEEWVRKDQYESTRDKSARVDSPLQSLELVHYDGHETSRDYDVAATVRKFSTSSEQSISTEHQAPTIPPRNPRRLLRSINALEDDPVYSPSPTPGNASEVEPSGSSTSLPIRPTIALQRSWDLSHRGSRFFEDFSSEEEPLPPRPVQTDLAAQQSKGDAVVSLPSENVSRSRRGLSWSWRKRSTHAKRSGIHIQHIFRSTRVDGNGCDERPVSGRTLQEIAAAPFAVGSSADNLGGNPFIVSDDMEGGRAKDCHSTNPTQVYRWMQPLVLSAMFLVFVIVGLVKLARWRTGVLDLKGGPDRVGGLQMPTAGEIFIFFMAIVGVYVGVSEALRWTLLRTQKKWEGYTDNSTTLRATRPWCMAFMKWMCSGRDMLAVILGAVMAGTFVAGVVWGVLRM